MGRDGRMAPLNRTKGCCQGGFFARRSGVPFASRLTVHGNGPHVGQETSLPFVPVSDPSMRPFLHPNLVNGRTGDPAVYIETLFEKQTVLFDLGDISNLPPRKIHRLDHVFVSHTHIDHFIGFDRLLRVLAGRESSSISMVRRISSSRFSISCTPIAGTSWIAISTTLFSG